MSNSLIFKSTVYPEWYILTFTLLRLGLTSSQIGTRNAYSLGNTMCLVSWTGLIYMIHSPSFGGICTVKAHTRNLPLKSPLPGEIGPRHSGANKILLRTCLGELPAR